MINSSCYEELISCLKHKHNQMSGKTQTEWGVTLKSDPFPNKRGKGKPDLNSSVFIFDLALFVSSNVQTLTDILDNYLSMRKAGFNHWLLNLANEMVMKVDVNDMDFTDPVNRNLWLFAAWATMVTAEFQTEFPYDAYSEMERKLYLSKFLVRYFRESISLLETGVSDTGTLSMHLLPPLAMERLSLHHELVSRNIGIGNAQKFKTEGISVASRMGSVKRHFDKAFWDRMDEDHLIHLVWNLMAIYHVCMVFPERVDVVLRSRS